MNREKESSMEGKYKLKGDVFFIASATIFCGGLDFEDIWVKISEILPYLYGYGKKMEIQKIRYLQNQVLHTI